MGKGGLRNVAFSDVHPCVDNVEEDGDGEGTLRSGDYVGGLFLCEERGEGILLLADRFGGEMTATLETGGHRLDDIDI